MTQIRPTLGDHLQFRNGRAPSSRSDGGRFPIYGSNGFIGRSDSENAHAGAIVVGRVGSFCGSVHFSKGPCWVTDNAIVANPKTEDSPRFWYYALKHLDLNRHSQGSGQALLNQTVLSNISFTPPGTQARAAIAEVLGALDDKIAANRRIIDASEELQLALFRRISRTGEHLRLGEMIRLMYGKALPQDMRVPGEVAVVGSGGVVGSHTEGLVSGPAVVVGRKGSVGTVHWIDRDAYPIDTTFWVEPIDELPLPYLHRLLESLPLNSMSSDSAVPGLNREHAYSLLLPAHDREDINLFARDVEGLIARSSLAERENQVLASTRDELLPLLMSGRITVRAASSHVEEVV